MKSERDNSTIAQLEDRARRHPLYQRWLRSQQDRVLAIWARGTGEGPSPPLLKQHVVRAYARRFGVSTLVESGTYLGEMVEGTARDFAYVYSIELDEALHQRALARLAHLPNVSLLLGDSGDLLAEVISRLEGPCLFWLDGHYSGGVTARGREDSPVRREIDQIAASGRVGDVVLIDDARCFNGQDGYPTLEEAVALLQHQLHGVVSVAEDIIRATPRWP